MQIILLGFALCIKADTGAVVIEHNNDLTNSDTLTSNTIVEKESFAIAETDLVLSRKKESTLGNFITDSMVNAFKNETKMAVLQSKYVNIKRLRKGKISVDSFKNISRPIFSLVFRFPPAFISNVNLFKVIYFIPNYIRRLSVNKTENINSRINIIETRAVMNIIIVFLYSSRPLIRTWQSALL